MWFQHDGELASFNTFFEARELLFKHPIPCPFATNIFQFDNTDFIFYITPDNPR